MAAPEAQLGDPLWARRVPRFLPESDPWHRVFGRNVADLLPWRRPKPLELTSAPAAFWPDVFVSTRVSWGSLRQSVLYHAFVVTAFWGLWQTYWARPRVVIEPVTRHTTLTYYQVSEYLPPLLTPGTPARVKVHGQPVYSPQAIISLPENPDNARQTIVNPAAPKLIPHAVKLPNLVVATPAPEPPVAGATRSASQLTLPWLGAAVVPPPEENTSRRVADVNLPGPCAVGRGAATRGHRRAPPACRHQYCARGAAGRRTEVAYAGAARRQRIEPGSPRRAATASRQRGRFRSAILRAIARARTGSFCRPWVRSKSRRATVAELSRPRPKASRGLQELRTSPPLRAGTAKGTGGTGAGERQTCLPEFTSAPHHRAARRQQSRENLRAPLPRRDGTSSSPRLARRLTFPTKPPAPVWRELPTPAASSRKSSARASTTRWS